MRAAIVLLALAGMTFARQPASALPTQAAAIPPSQTVKRMSEVHALRLQLLQTQYQLVVREICEEAGFSMAECQPRAEAGVVIRVPPEAPKVLEAKKPEAVKPEPAKPAPPKPEK